ncbi:hypothetical protein ITG09_05170 [Vibrio cyclitrophicus]|nr:hypothetical protein [Vibrio cyclitrophicus]UPR53021.1 hypothetical protein ITG09_05170 [Vibrio cyclitrophicus]
MTNVNHVLANCNYRLDQLVGMLCVGRNLIRSNKYGNNSPSHIVDAAECDVRLRPRR